MSIGLRDSLGAYGATAGAMASATMKPWSYAPDSLVAGAGEGGASAYQLDGATKYLRMYPEPSPQECVWHFFLEPAAGSDTSDLLLFKDIFGTTNLSTLQLMADGRVRLRRGDSGSGGTILYTSPAAIVSFDERKHWQVRFKTQIVSGPAIGELEIKIEDVQVVLQTGLETSSRANSNYRYIGETTIGKGVVGLISHPICVLVDGTNPNTFLGKKCVYCRRADGDVVATMTQVGGTGGQPYTAVDDVALDTSDYNEGDVDEQNEYQYADVPSALTGIVEVSKSCYRAKVGSGSISYNQFIRSNGVRLDSGSDNPAAGAGYRTFGAVTDPDGGGAWTAAKVNALTGGEFVGTWIE